MSIQGRVINGIVSLRKDAGPNPLLPTNVFVHLEGINTVPSSSRIAMP